MSASLVGSEMCIRDSSSGIAGRQFAIRPCPQGRPSGASPPAEVPARQQPVSYTHLTLPTICSV
eukprot:10282152-Alexandrium_andersonii.AAC.1